MSERNLKIQSRTRNGIRFYAIMAMPDGCRYLRGVKKTRDLSLIDSDKIMQAVIRCAAIWCRRGEYEVITVPPASKAGMCWAGDVAERISRLAGVPFVQFFEPHNMGKRCYLGAKFQPIPIKWAVECTWRRVMVFDDFSMTNLTITNTIREIRRFAYCDGLVICVS